MGAMGKRIHLIEGIDYCDNLTSREGRREYRLLRPVPIWVPNARGIIMRQIVPAGYITDWGSVPVLADKWFGINTRRGSITYLNHDACYAFCLAPSRKVADDLMRDNLKYDGAGIIERAVVWLSVRLFGGGNYCRD